MTPLEHLNAFCVLFSQLKDICNSGGAMKESQAAVAVRKKMYGHYPFLDDKMVKYLDSFTGALISLGFNFDEMKQASRIDVSDIDTSKEVAISGKFNFAKVVDANEKGKIYNYNEHSTPLTQLSSEEFQAIRQKTINNIKIEQMLMAKGQRPKAPQPKTWSLPDAARDW
jgi:hypothetical protein